MRNARLITCIMLLVFALTASAIDAAEPRLHSLPYTAETDDGLTLHAWLTPSPAEKPAPLYVLLPMMGHTHDSYNDFINALYKRVAANDSVAAAFRLPNILALDLRGHGKSTRIGDSSINYAHLSKAEFAKYPSDIATMIRRVLADKSRRFDRSETVVIGASIGANSAIMLHGLVEPLSRVVMLSPGEDYRSLRPAEAVSSFKGDILIFAGKEDSYSRQSSENLAALNLKHATLKIYPGADHGTRILRNNPAAMNDLINWILK